ncbi:UDP-N-acetylmuramoyl-L-alanyl-D-glutamate--2,6-diaminopimelate ligase [Tepidicella baoligensis]|uniref:UDP-N-acetylmuramoyl-L-alanyl-D-glutamate--2, 6-diaminopimelate ligase n=1 Tax=Tepidicella baoligensis TaxID=2707016 RepID=UPI0015DA1678|nr:UDP-N-acetylmuramoyl-L-alanyl-D-glutamate--2,6-diaminopimelate ligase [Tepidicella baoligensis]
MRHLTHAAEAAAWLKEHQARRLVCDSRQLQAGDAFVAWPGSGQDGRRFVNASLRAGATACLIEAEGAELWGFTDDRIAAFAGLKGWAGEIAAEFADHPSRRLRTVAVTGTNGKTSTAWWCAQWLSAVGHPAALIGTLGAGVPHEALQPTGFTTPDPMTLQALLKRFVDEGRRTVVMEASSIGIEEGRLNGTHLHTAVFTNLSQDHLDYHGTMEAYWAAKRALFDWPGLQVAVVNLDDAHGRSLADELAARTPAMTLWTVSVDEAAPGHRGASLRVAERAWTATGLHFVVEEQPSGERVAMALGVVGDYNLSNLLCALAVLRSGGVSLADAAQASHALTAVPGRMHAAWADGPADLPLVLVDYAHTPDALEKALRALQPLAAHRGGRLWCVFGCGGDRDRGKRPLMAAAAEREAARLVLTSDNPRSEDPLQILFDMQAGLTEPVRAIVEPDRAEAIREAVNMADARDVILLAGKGHEDYQEVAGEKRPFSDVVQGRQALQARWQSQQGGAA